MRLHFQKEQKLEGEQQNEYHTYLSQRGNSGNV